MRIAVLLCFVSIYEWVDGAPGCTSTDVGTGNELFSITWSYGFDNPGAARCNGNYIRCNLMAWSFYLPYPKIIIPYNKAPVNSTPGPKEDTKHQTKPA